jgi:hypothetical protein
MSAITHIISWENGVGHCVWTLILIFFVRFCAWIWGKPLSWKKEAGFWLGGIFAALLVLIFIDRMLPLPPGKPAFRPEFPGGIVLGTFEDKVGTDKGKTHVFIACLKIFNTGAPSIVHDWKLRIKGPDNKWVETRFIDDQDTFTFQAKVTVDGPPKLFEPKDSLVVKTRSTPIPTGSMQEGHVAFVITETSSAYALDPRTIYEVSWRDVMNESYYATFHFPPPSR